MTPRFELVGAVTAAEDVRSVWCDTCMSSNAFEAALFALVPSGLQQLGTFRTCERCNPDRSTLTCFYCGTTVDDGGRFWVHIRDVHSKSGG
ncbi:hypothetical protein OOJ91_12340 [Micromonospora lupini]|uniref:hypothetical protein n=1 Tax=Micromonospora lupini TaxID=285679 RepID=UPI00225755F8|nr:hypothetical protein [Micromonospora lupini]MCX5066668.1 hypothetical protein [Micromonospora lupini]